MANQVNLTSVTVIVVISLIFFLYTFYKTINTFKTPIRRQDDDQLTFSSSSQVEFVEDSRCLINSTIGLIQGHVVTINETSNVCEFLGIPYAMAPIAKLRFMKPIKMKELPMNETWFANKWPANCVQTFPNWAKFMMRQVIEEINEDCLYLNVWSPLLKTKEINLPKESKTSDDNVAEEKLPIIFWIHGGGYQFGSGSLQETNGSTLSSFTNSVVVTINYRLNAFGFLNLNSFATEGEKDEETDEAKDESEEKEADEKNEEEEKDGEEEEEAKEKTSSASAVQGNQGLYDQSMALDWIRDNVNCFNGDINSITLMGQGMGGISISIHLFSPLMRNKFQRAIIQTGTLFTSRSMYSNGDVIAEQLINLLSCGQSGDEYYEADDEAKEDVEKEEVEEDNPILVCLQKKTSEEIRLAVEEINSKNPISFLFSPFEQFINYSSPSDIKADVSKYLSPSVKDIIFGFNSEEGSLILNSLLPETFSSFSQKVPNISSTEDAKEILTSLFVNRLQVPKSVINVGLSSAFSTSSSRSADDAKDATKDEEKSQKIVKSMIDFVGNNIFVCPTILAAQELSKVKGQVNVHLYTFTQRTSYNKLPDWFGTIHNEEVPIMFGHPVRYPNEYSLKEINFSLKLMNLIGSFAKTGKVIDDWPSYSSSNQKYLDINPTEFKVGTGINDKSCSLFEIGMDLA